MTTSTMMIKNPTTDPTPANITAPHHDKNCCTNVNLQVCFYLYLRFCSVPHIQLSPFTMNILQLNYHLHFHSLCFYLPLFFLLQILWKSTLKLNSFLFSASNEAASILRNLSLSWHAKEVKRRQSCGQCGLRRDYES